jgi:hypothetical protein
MSFIPVGFMLGGFLLAAIISERSLRDVDETQQGRLLKGTATLRKIRLLGIPLAASLATVRARMDSGPSRIVHLLATEFGQKPPQTNFSNLIFFVCDEFLPLSSFFSV